MDPIEKAIRGALEKGDADDRAFREKVYRSAFTALDRALQGSAAIAPEAAAQRRSELQAKIAEIETEFIAAVPVVESPDAGGGEPDGEAPAVEIGGPVGAPAAPEVSVADAAPRPRAEPDFAEAVKHSPRPEREPSEPPSRTPAVDADGRPLPKPFFPDAADFGAAGAALPRPVEPAIELSATGGPNVATERRRPLAAAFLGVTVLALAAIGLWWALSTGLIKLPRAGDDSGEIVQLPPEEEDYTPGQDEAPALPGQIDQSRDWITVFSPSDNSTINAPADAKAEVMSDDSGEFLRIRSGSSGSAVSFDVAKGTLEAISGKHAVFDIVARAEEGQETQFAVDCNFGELGGCGRKRYHAGYEKGDFLFEMELPSGAPGAEGTIAITSDIGDAGKAIDVYEIKVSVSE